MKTLPILALLIVLCVAGVSCDTGGIQRDAKSEPRTFQAKGVIREIKPDGKTVVIQHESIPGYMAAMTMPFTVKDTPDLSNLTVGDSISFRLLVTEKDGWIDQVKKTGHSETEPPKAPPSMRLVRNVEPLKVGDPIPSYPFTNELGHAVSLTDFNGDAVALTFIYTRCPFPNFCPRMTSNFSEVYKKLTSDPHAPKNWHLVSLTFDPEHDTPSILLHYAKNQNYDPKKWSFLTGALIEIDAITEQFGLGFSRSETFGFDHNLRAVVINAQGKVQKIIIGNEWKVDDLAAEMITAAGAK